MILSTTEHVSTVARLCKNHSILLCFAVFIGLFACSRYEDNNGIQVASVNKRLIDDWMLDTVINKSLAEGITLSDFNAPVIDSITNDTIGYDTFQVFNGQSELITFTPYLEDKNKGALRVRIMETLQDYEVADWTLSSDKKYINIVVRYEDGTIYEQRNWRITRLDKNYLWYHSDDGAQYQFSRHTLEIDDINF